MTTMHGALTGADNMHVPYAWTFANKTAREAGVGVDARGVGKLARQLDDNSLWMLVGTAPITWKAAGGGSSFPSGTRMPFQQTTAPTGWTKDATHNNKALRVVSGTVGSGGSVDFSTLFGRTATDATTLSVAQMPSHGHTIGMAEGDQYDFSGYLRVIGGLGYYRDYTKSGPGGLANGSGGSHVHSLDMRVKYLDLIIAQKD